MKRRNNAAGEVEEFFALQQVGQDKGQPLDEEGQSNRKGKEWDAKGRGATLAAGQGDPQADQDDDGKDKECITICFFHGVWSSN